MLLTTVRLTGGFAQMGARGVIGQKQKQKASEAFRKLTNASKTAVRGFQALRGAARGFQDAYEFSQKFRQGLTGGQQMLPEMPPEDPFRFSYKSPMTKTNIFVMTKRMI